MSTDANPQIGLVRFESHFRVDPFLELNSLKDVVDDCSRNVHFLSSKFGRIFVVFFTMNCFNQGPRHLFSNRLEECVLKLIVH
jgi:hypothetical protein